MMTRTLSALFAAALIFAACSSGSDGSGSFGGDRSDTTTAEPNPAASTPDGDKGSDGKSEEKAGAGDLPAVEVIDIASEERFPLTDLAPADKPLLVWFWAPH